MLIVTHLITRKLQLFLVIVKLEGRIPCQMESFLGSYLNENGEANIPRDEVPV